MKARDKERLEAIEHLRTMIKPGDTVHTVLRHVSKSGMTRGIDVYFMPRATYRYADANTHTDNLTLDDAMEFQRKQNGGTVTPMEQQPEPVWITAYVGKAIDSPQPMEYWRKSLGLKIGGCGMDMGFHVVNSLSYALYGEGYQCLGKGKCPSNYHSNHHDTVQCEGTMVWNNDGPNTGERCRFESGKGWVIDGKRCPKCKGKGRLPNPDGPERFDLVHKDGYALKHRWL